MQEKVNLVIKLTAASIFLIVALSALFLTGNSMSAMNCKSVDIARFKHLAAAELNEPLYQNSLQEPDQWEAHFTLHNFGAESSSTLLIVSSDSANGVIFKGPISNSFRVTAKRSFSQRGGHDSFRFVILDEKTNKICVAEHEGEFWQPGKSIVIELLEKRQTDRNGLPIAFKLIVQ